MYSLVPSPTISLFDSDKFTLWQDFNGCESFVQENLLSKGGLNVGIESKHTNCLNDTEIIYTILSNQKHEWFGGSKVDYDSFGSTEVIWNFLRDYDIKGKNRDSN